MIYIRKVILILVIIFVINIKVEIKSAEVDKLSTLIGEQVDIYNYDDIDGIINKSYGSSISTKEIITGVLTGRTTFTIKEIINTITYIIFSEMKLHLEIVRNIILVGLGSAFIKVLTDSLKTKGVGELTFYIMYISIITLLITSFELVYSYTLDLLIEANNFMLNTIPIIISSLFISGNPNSALLAQPLLLTVSYIMITIFKNIILPFIYLMFIVEIFNNLTKREVLGGLIDVSRKIIKEGIKYIVIIFIGVLSLFKMSTPISDGLVKKVLQSTLNVVPVIGTTISTGLETVMYFSDAFKSGLTVALIIGALIISFYYVVNIFSVMIVYTYAGIVIEPICDGRIYKAFKTIQIYIGFLLSVLTSTLLMMVMSFILILSV